ncbi:hypothetical protein ACP70R_025305 [Stipagrostis hirtigluma subsp. patula]
MVSLQARRAISRTSYSKTRELAALPFTRLPNRTCLLEMASRSRAFAAIFLAVTLLFSAGAGVVRGQRSGNPCPTNALADLKVCADVLVLLKLKINVPASQQCCPLLGSLVNADLAACLCAAIRLSVLGIPVNLPLDVPLVLNYCGRNASAPGANCS